MPHPHYLSTDNDTPDKVKEKLARLRGNASLLETNPCLAFTMHPGAHRNDQNEGSCFDLVAGRPEYWFCTQDEYSAYRVQFHLSKVAASVRGNVLTVVLSRPALESLGNAIPITLAVAGVSSSAVREIKAADAVIERRDTGEEVRFDLGHARSQVLPEKIDWIANEQNVRSFDLEKHRSADFPGLGGLLWKEGESLKWQLRNDTGRDLTNLRAIYRLPVGYQDGNRIVVHAALAKGAVLSHSETLAVAPGDDPRRLLGNEFLAVEINFTQGEKRGRLYLTSFAPSERTLDRSYPNNNFVRIGPIPRSQYVPQMAEDLAAGKTDQVVLKDGSVLKAQPIEVPATPGQRGVTPADLHPEMVLTTGRPSLRSMMKADGIWIYRTIVRSEKEEDAVYRPVFYPNAAYDLNKKTVYVNGKRLEDGRLTLHVGSNDVIVVYETWSKMDALSYQNAGFFFQITSPTTRRRLETIEYALPTAKPGE